MEVNCSTDVEFDGSEKLAVFDDDSDLVFKRQAFIDEKPEYYRYSNKTEELTGAEQFAQFAPAED